MRPRLTLVNAYVQAQGKSRDRMLRAAYAFAEGKLTAAEFLLVYDAIHVREP